MIVVGPALQAKQKNTDAAAAADPKLKKARESEKPAPAGSCLVHADEMPESGLAFREETKTPVL